MQVDMTIECEENMMDMFQEKPPSELSSEFMKFLNEKIADGELIIVGYEENVNIEKGLRTIKMKVGRSDAYGHRRIP